MQTTDIALLHDPSYAKIARRYYENPDEFAEAFAEAWYKLTHRDMGPHIRLRGSDVPSEPRLWQDPVPPCDHPLIQAEDIATLKREILDSGLTNARLVATAWASASTYRNSDKRGGANGARIRLAPQKDWAVNEPEQLAYALAVLDGIQQTFNAVAAGGKRVSLADLIVLGGAAAIEDSALRAGLEIEVPFTPGRMDAAQDQTDVESFAHLEPKADGFRNYVGAEMPWSQEEMLVDRADLLKLTAPEMAALLGGLRVLGVNVGGSPHGVFTERPGMLTNDFFVNLLASSLNMTWVPSSDDKDVFTAHDRKTGAVWRSGTRVDLIFGSNAQLRAIAEAYADDGAGSLFVDAFVAAWSKVMELDRFDLA